MQPETQHLTTYKLRFCKHYSTALWHTPRCWTIQQIDTEKCEICSTKIYKLWHFSQCVPCFTQPWNI